MPRKLYEIKKFSGGLNAWSDPRDIEDTEFAQNWNIIVDKEGVLRIAGLAEYSIACDYHTNPNYTPGTGLFQFSVDHSITEIDSDFDVGIETGTIDTYASTTSFTLEDTNSASSTDDYYNDMTIFIYSGTGAGESRLITDYTGSSRTIACEAFATTLHAKDDGTPSKYIIYRWKTDGTNWQGSAAKKDWITDGTTPISALEAPVNSSYYIVTKRTSITDEQSVNLGSVLYEPLLTLKPGVEYIVSFDCAAKDKWYNLVSNGSENGSGTMYGDRVPWIQLYSSTTTDGTNTGLSLHTNNTWVTGTENAGYLLLVDANFIDNGDFTGGASEWTEVDLGGVLAVAEEAAGDAYGGHDGTLTMTTNGSFGWSNGAPDSFIYQQLSLDDNTPYHMNLVYGSDTGGLAYSIVDLTNLVNTGVVTNLGSTISDTGDGLTSGDSLTCAVDGTTATDALLLNKYIYESDGTFIGKCTNVHASGTPITFGGGVAVDLDDGVTLYTESTIKNWTALSHTGALTTYKYPNEHNDTVYLDINTEYISFRVPDNSGGTESNIQVRFSNAVKSSNVNLAAVSLHKAYNDLATMSYKTVGANPFTDNVKAWTKYSAKFKIPEEYDKTSDWYLKLHAGQYSYRGSNSVSAADTQEVYFDNIKISSIGGDTITALSEATSTYSAVGLYSPLSGVWDMSSLRWNGLNPRFVYDFVNGALQISDGNFNNSNNNKIMHYVSENKMNQYSRYGWQVQEEAIPNPPSIISTSINRSGFIPDTFEALSYLNKLNYGLHYKTPSGITTTWNSDEFGNGDDVFGNGIIVRYFYDQHLTVSLANESPDTRRILVNPDSTTAHSTRAGFQVLSASEANIHNDAQNPVCCWIQGTDTSGVTINSVAMGDVDMDTVMSSAGSVAKIEYDIDWDISCDYKSGSSGPYFGTCRVPYFTINVGKPTKTMTTDATTDASDGEKHQECVIMGQQPFIEIDAATLKTNHHGKEVSEAGITFDSINSSDSYGENIDLISLNISVGDHNHHTNALVNFSGEVSFERNEIAKTDDIMFRIHEEGQDEISNSIKNYLDYGIYDVDDKYSEYFSWANYTRFKINELRVYFYDPNWVPETDSVTVNGGNETQVNLVWAEPDGVTSTGWGERIFTVGVSSVNIFGEESSINQDSSQIGLSDAGDGTISIGYAPTITIIVGNEVLKDPYRRETKFYMKDNESDIWYLQFYVDHKTGYVHSTTTGRKQLGVQDTSINSTTWTIEREYLKDFNEVNSYQSETMVSQEDSESNKTLTCRYKASVIANNRKYVGNVLQNGKVYGDRMLKSPINKYNVLPASSFIDVVVNDGDEITALAYYKDKILQFKKKKVFVINISGDYEFLEDTFYDVGVVAQCSVADTPYGIVWANKSGCYLYDGEKLTNLIDKKIPNSASYTTGGQVNNRWGFADTTLTSASIVEKGKMTIGYIRKRDSILVKFEAENLTALTQASGATYHFPTNSWTMLRNVFTNTLNARTGNTSNMITDSDGEILFYHIETSNVRSSHPLSTDVIKKWNHDPTDDDESLKVFYFYSKDITFGEIADYKKLYRVYITYRVKTDGTDSGVVVKGAVNGTYTYDVAFSASKSKFKGTETLCYGSSTLDETDGKWKTAELIFSNLSDVKKISSFQLYIYSENSAIDFEINDISISYRTTRRK